MNDGTLSTTFGALALGAAGTLAFALSDASAAASALPDVGVVGAAIDAVPGLAREPREPETDAEPERSAHGAPRVPFGALLFADYDAPELRDPPGVALAASAFPASASRWNGERVTLDGYMLALDVLDDTTTSFLLARFPPGCCFGVTPVLDEWVDVSVVDGLDERYGPSERIFTTGVLDVGERIDEDGLVQSLYRLDADTVDLVE